VFLLYRKLSWSVCWHDWRQKVKSQQLTAFKCLQSVWVRRKSTPRYETNGWRRSEKLASNWFYSLVAVLCEVLTFWNVTPYILTEVQRRFGPTYCLHLHRRKYRKEPTKNCCLPTTIKMAAVCSFKTLNYRTTWSHASEENTLVLIRGFSFLGLHFEIIRNVARQRAEQPKNRCSIPDGEGIFFFSPQRSNRLRGPPSLLSKAYQMLFAREHGDRSLKLTTHFHLVPKW
jgi:hypothetical protein